MPGFPKCLPPSILFILLAWISITPLRIFAQSSNQRPDSRQPNNFYLHDTSLLKLHQQLHAEDSLMEKGIQLDTDTRKTYFTGYDYKTLYDWDQYFESIVQIYMGKPADRIINGITIFLDHQKENGFIVRSVPGNEFHDREHLKPFLCQISILVMDKYNQAQWLNDNYFNRLKKYLDYWLDQMDGDGNGLSEWMSSPHTGMDNQHERAGWWGDRTSEGVDLNCYLVKEMRAFAAIAERRGKKELAAGYRARAEKKAGLIRTKLWDEKTGFFYDNRYKTDQKIWVKSISGFTPLWAGIATPEQARRMIYDQLMNPGEFWSPWPVPALARSEPGYSEKMMASDLGCSWRANTWISTNYMLFHGLKYYGYNDLASLLAQKTEDLIQHAGNREYYHSESGTGTGLNPFWGWSLLGHFFNYEDRNRDDITRFTGDGIVISKQQPKE
ncbi:amylo-alpha-1,6-glucosidase [Flavitalea flava]